MVKLYLAGPLFTAAEREFNRELNKSLEAIGYECWLPQEYEPRDKTAEAIFRADVAGIDWADAVVACMDGPDPDSGTAWECGYAYGKKPVILYRTDFRADRGVEGEPYNLMLSASCEVRLEFPMDTSVFRIASALHEKMRAVPRLFTLAHKGG